MIKNIHITGFRNLATQNLELDSPICLVTGSNGSGKTSLLEAIYTQLNGKSFRSPRTSNILQRSSSELGDVAETAEYFVLRSQICLNDSLASSSHSTHSVAIKKSASDKYIAKVDGELASSISDLAAIYPSMIVEPKTFNIFSGGAGSRRKLLDWIVFHVEHSFANEWKSYNAVLKQRNSFLRSDRIDVSALDPWDHQLVRFSQMLDAKRRDVWMQFQSYFQRFVIELLDDQISDKLLLSYYPGWNSTKGFEATLKEGRGKDIKQRYTHYGAHRADVKITFKGLPIEEGLSRGQQKLLVIAFHLAAVSLLKELRNKRSLILLDDLAAEIDESNLTKLFAFLSKLKTAVIATGLDQDLFLRALDQAEIPTEMVKMFHVEHGLIQQTNTN